VIFALEQFLLMSYLNYLFICHLVGEFPWNDEQRKDLSEKFGQNRIRSENPGFSFFEIYD